MLRKILWVIALTAVVFATVMSVFIGWKVMTHQPAAVEGAAGESDATGIRSNKTE
ncbi:hypothetical protein [Paracoccus amoyensis]|uniref:hypothetical protein n=1 Tax=Paracoccus amoyensis TaxID=2760093 RepID=UPI0016595DEC|nr:hypothetical protein [Paracoccus amoyensis]